MSFKKWIINLLFFRERRRFIKAIEQREKALRKRNGIITRMHHQRYVLRQMRNGIAGMLEDMETGHITQDDFIMNIKDHFKRK